MKIELLIVASMMLTLTIVVASPVRKNGKKIIVILRKGKRITISVWNNKLNPNIFTFTLTERAIEDRVSSFKQNLSPHASTEPPKSKVAATEDGHLELMVLQKMPAIIRKLKAHKLTAFELSTLQNRFGPLWHLLVDESKRSTTEEMNPILSTLLRSKRIAFNNKNSNDINNEVMFGAVKNGGRRQRLSGSSRLANLRLKDNLSPDQRLLKVAAILIRETLSRTTNVGNRLTHKRNGASRKARRHYNRTQKKQPQLPSDQNEAALATKFTQPEVILNAMRPKRSLQYAVSAENDEIAMNLLKSMLETTKAKDDDDDYNYDDNVEKPDSKRKQIKKDGKNRDEPTDQRKQAQQLKREQQEKQADFIKTADYKDYAFDTTDTDRFDEDEDLLRSFYGQKRRAAYDDYDYGGFSDLMHLAAKHTLRAQREDKYLSRLHFDDYLNDNRAEYSDEDYDA